MKLAAEICRLSWTRLAIIALAAALSSGCGASSQYRTETVQIELRPTAAGGLSIEPRGRHLDWPAVTVVKLVNYDLVSHSLYFADLGQELSVEGASADAPGVAYYSLGLLPRGNHPWTCRARCPSPTAEGFLHVAMWSSPAFADGLRL